MASSTDEERLSLESEVRVHHVYKSVLTPELLMLSILAADEAS